MRGPHVEGPLALLRFIHLGRRVWPPSIEMPSSSSSSPPTHAPSLRQLAGVVLSIAILALAGGWSAVSARADGDPASDVLATQSLFLPQDAGISIAQQAQLGSLVADAQRDGYSIRVALIASAADLGSVTELWRAPQSYAEFLGQELSLIYRGQLLVIMPGGFGLYRQGAPFGAQRDALAGLRAPAAGDQLATAATAAVQHLAASAGHALSTRAIAAGRTAGSSGSNEILPGVVLVFGAALIALAWTASIRARPLSDTSRLSRAARSSRTSP